MGRYAAQQIAREAALLASNSPLTHHERPPFIYHDKGALAIIGKAKAVAHIGKWKVGGFLAWLLWGGVHILFLIGFRNRLLVLLHWFWGWLLNARDARLITGDARLDIQVPLPPDFVPDKSAPPDAPPGE